MWLLLAPPSFPACNYWLNCACVYVFLHACYGYIHVGDMRACPYTRAHALLRCSPPDILTHALGEPGARWLARVAQWTAGILLSLPLSAGVAHAEQASSMGAGDLTPPCI